MADPKSTATQTETPTPPPIDQTPEGITLADVVKALAPYHGKEMLDASAERQLAAQSQSAQTSDASASAQAHRPGDPNPAPVTTTARQRPAHVGNPAST